jgi:Family of unknown function (DUF6325)
MPYGPVEMLALQTSAAEPAAGIVTALRDVVDGDTIRIIDIAFVHADPGGAVTTSELADLEGPGCASLTELISEVSGLISEEDLAELGDALLPESSAGVLLLEHHWARRMSERTRRAGGRVLLHLRVPREAVNEATAARSPTRR